MSQIPTKGYVFKWAQESAFFAFLGIGTLLFTTLSNLDTTKDWKTWALSLGVGAGRVVGAVMVNQFLKLKGA